MRKAQPEFLLVDLGNTRMKWSTTGKNSLTRSLGDVPTQKMTYAWINFLSKKYPKHTTVLSCVVPKLLPLFRRAFGPRLITLQENLPELNLAFDYPKPTEIGADRIAAAVAVQSDGKFPAIIVACGTATAFSVLDAKGRFCGGVIAPGLQTQLAALLGATAQLPATHLKKTHTVLAKSTEDAIRAGVILNFQGGVKEILHHLTRTLPRRPKLRIILTGGNASLLSKSLAFPHTLRPLLVFEGLRIIGLRVWKQHPS